MIGRQETRMWQDMFTRIVEDADANILLLDEDFRVIDLNPRFYWIFFQAYGVEMKRGRSLLAAMEDKDQALTWKWKEHFLAALSGTAIKTEEIFEVDGRKYYWEIHIRSSARPDGSQIISVFSRDISVRKTFQRKIVENEANLRSIFNTIDDGVWLVNSAFELIDFNREFYRRYKQAFGIKLIKGASILSLFPREMPELTELWKSRYERGLSGIPGKYYDTYPAAKHWKSYEIKTFPIVQGGLVTGLTLYARDITNQTITENLLKQQNEELIMINEELDRFVYSASHDLRAPLMSVKGLINVIKLDREEKNVKYHLELIEKSVLKLDHFITDIIHHSRNARMEIMPKQICFDTLVAESIESLKFMDGAADVESIKSISVAEPFYSDYGRLLIVFNNIIANAVRYRDPWKEHSFLKIEIAGQHNGVICRFSDNGIGISPEYIDSIFKMFYRANADSKGSGLGLYIVKSAVTKLKGNISVESTLGEGTTFTVEIPNLKPDAFSPSVP